MDNEVGVGRGGRGEVRWVEGRVAAGEGKGEGEDERRRQRNGGREQSVA